MISAIVALYAKWGMHNYDEDISQMEHAMQCAALARNAGAPDELVIASLLHDIGHLLELESASGNVNIGIDDRHESTGARYLAQMFGAGVTAPVALHVQAKRYLCAMEPHYYSTLSTGSLHSLELQGGPMSPDEMTRYEGLPGFESAIALRRWDEHGKLTDVSVMPFDAYLPMMQTLLI